jgi:hypothetical protein
MPDSSEADVTKSEMIEVMNIYFVPLFQILGGIAAVIVIALAYYLVIAPFLRRI